MENLHVNDFLILGGGLAGLAAGTILNQNATILEKESRPGGLVKSQCFDGYWYDHVLHLLHFRDDSTELKIKELLGDVLQALPPVAWVETPYGKVLYPFQLHLGGLPKPQVIKCLTDYTKQYFSTDDTQPTNFKKWLEMSFGKSICEIFMYPYNEKVWKRPLENLSAIGFQWNINRPKLEDIIAGVIEPLKTYEAYNSNGWYPQAPKDAPIRCMEVLPAKLAERVKNLLLNHNVKKIDLKHRIVQADYDGQLKSFKFKRRCLSTIPLPELVKLCEPIPQDLKEQCLKLKYNSVISVMINIRGPRPKNVGLWHYYSDKDIIFTRLVFMHKFDSLTAPSDGWGLMAEVTRKGEDPLYNEQQLIEKVVEDVRSLGLVDGCEIKAVNTLMVPYGYVVFEPETELLIKRISSYLETFGISLVGRYSRWEYSSMAQVMRDGFEWGTKNQSKVTQSK